jgi:hypothetical protein
VTHTDSGYVLYYAGGGIAPIRSKMGRATSADGIVWTKYNDPSTSSPYAESDPVLWPGLPDAWDYRYVFRSSVRQTAGGWEVFYGGYGPLHLSSAIGYASTLDGIHWTKDTRNPLLAPKDDPMAAAYLQNPSFVQAGSIDWLYYDDMEYFDDLDTHIGVATRTTPLPIIVVEPQAMEANLYADEQLTQTLWISNTGGVALHFSLHELSRTVGLVLTPARGDGRIDSFEAISATPGGPLPPYDIPWLSEEPTNGTVDPDSGRPIAVTFDAAGLALGIYQGLLQVESNDPVTPQVSIPVTLTVVACEPVTATAFTWEPLTPTVGQVVTFAGTATGTLPLTYTWDFGDGTGALAPCSLPLATCSVTHSYALPGDYAVILIATNCVSATAQASAVLTVLPQPGEHYYVYLPLVSRAP